MLRRIRQHWKNYIGSSRMAITGCIILGIWIILAIAVPLFGPWSFSEQNAAIRNQTSSLMHWFGTDRFGRDLFARVWYGAGISLAVGIILCLIQQYVGVIRMPGSFVVEYYPVVIKPGDIILTLGGIALIGLLITALPTRRTLSRIL